MVYQQLKEEVNLDEIKHTLYGPEFVTKPSDGVAPVLELWRILSIRVLFMGQMELVNHLLPLKPFKCVNKWIKLIGIISAW